MKRIFIFWACMCLCSLLGAQTLAPVTWEVYGLTFHAPKGAIVEEDTEDMFLLNNSSVNGDGRIGCGDGHSFAGYR